MTDLKHLCERLDRLRNKCTPGEWHPIGVEDGFVGEVCGNHRVCANVEADDAILIAETHNSLPTLLAAAREVDSLRKERQELMAIIAARGEVLRQHGLLDVPPPVAAIASLDGDQSK